MPAPAKKPKATNVIGLVSVLQESLKQSKSKPAARKKKADTAPSGEKNPRVGKRPA